MLGITGATGQLGRLVIASLLTQVSGSQICALVRDPNKAHDLQTNGLTVRKFNYDEPASLSASLGGIDKLLLISANEVGRRVAQHRAIIEAAKVAGVKVIAYTSILDADRSVLALADEHRQTEALLRDCGIPYVLLRNGWYTENYLASVPAALQHGVFIGSAAEGQISSAARADYAAAAAAVLMGDNHSGRTYELAGDKAYTLAELAAEVGKQSGKALQFQNLPQAAFASALSGAGVPKAFAELLADSDVGASRGALFNDSHSLSKLIGRPTTPLSQMVKTALAVQA